MHVFLHPSLPFYNWPSSPRTLSFTHTLSSQSIHSFFSPYDSLNYVHKVLLYKYAKHTNCNPTIVLLWSMGWKKRSSQFDQWRHAQWIQSTEDEGQAEHVRIQNEAQKNPHKPWYTYINSHTYTSGNVTTYHLAGWDACPTHQAVTLLFKQEDGVCDVWRSQSYPWIGLYELNTLTRRSMVGNHKSST